MKNTNEIIIRTAQISDLERLKKFFIKAYGEKTMFQNEDFLNHYFDASLNKKPVFSNCLIGINNKEEIVSHYGGLEYKLIIKNKIFSMIWGVSAYTLEEYRGKGVNSKIVEFITNNFEVNGVIGFTSQTSLFYQKLGYNIFNFEKFSRHILVLENEKTKEVCNYINQDFNFLKKQIKSLSEVSNVKYLDKVVELTAENIDNYELSLEEDFTEITTTQRTKDFLKWRFFKNPFIKYTLYGVIENGAIVAYIALRIETLIPFSYKVTRIIDLFGRVDAVKTLFSKTTNNAQSLKHIYIDFSKFGSMYEKELNSFGFISLSNEGCCILPQVTSPIENRPNGEFLGILSKTFLEDINSLTFENVYFTRMDSDRDRIANINQITESKNDKQL
jgi:GNAT superfamily N-acetyltransferase